MSRPGERHAKARSTETYLEAPEQHSVSTLRVATYNIHKGVLRDFFGLRRVARIHDLRARLHELDAVRGETHDEAGWHLDLDLAHADAVRLASQSWGAPLQPLLADVAAVDPHGVAG